MAFHLQQRGIFSEEDWHLIDPDQYKKHSNHAALILAEARRIYSSYSLYQTLEHNHDQRRLITPTQRHLSQIVINEGFIAPTFIRAIARWLESFSVSGMRDFINTLYIVGDTSSFADVFAQSIVKAFHCVLTADINHFDLKEFYKVQHETKFVFFPLACYAPFQNPLVNNMLQGRDTTLICEDRLVTVRPPKCLVRLKDLPHPDRIPTNHNQHIIIRFERYNRRISCFGGGELYEYLLRLKELYPESDLDCCNVYGYLCNRNCQYYPNCGTCKKYADNNEFFDFLLADNQ